jgi:hypothetical protein
MKPAEERDEESQNTALKAICYSYQEQLYINVLSVSREIITV